MFVGHYSVSYAGKAADQTIPLWVLFLAVQFLDVLWGIFVLLGVERARIVPGITATNPLDLYYMPYSHGLLTALFWSAVAGVAYRWWRRDSATGRAGLIVGAAVFSHWVFDLLMHRPDLPIVGDRMKVGLGLWNLPAAALALEAGLLFGGLLLYLRATRPITRGATWGFVIFTVAMLGLQLLIFFSSPPESARVAAASALFAYAFLATVAGWLERKWGVAADDRGTG